MDFSKLIPAVEALGINLYRMAFWQDGRIQDHCFQPVSNCSNSYSVAKLFCVTAIGMLQDEGLLDVKKPLKDYMGDLIPGDADPKWQYATVENALTHRLGFGEGLLDIDVDDASEYPTRDYLSIVFHHPLAYEPGEKYQYTDAAFYLVSRLVTCISGEKLDEFLNRRLFRPLKFREAAWSRCPMDYPMGATGLYIGAHDMVKLGAVYLEGGKWQDRRIVSEEWVKAALENGYELHSKSPAGWIGKGGMCGQMLMFNPEKKCAIAWHAHCSGEDIRKLIACIDEHL